MQYKIQIIHISGIKMGGAHKLKIILLTAAKNGGAYTMSILNAIKNKLVLRAYAVVKNERPYVDNYTKAA